MIPIYIGYDTRERLAWHVLAHSIIQHATLPCQFIPVGNTVLPAHLWARPKGPKDSTEFSTARFMVPAMQGYRGWAIFMDCDMVCAGDIANLWNQRDDHYAVMVVQHDHQPAQKEKFLGAEQTRYERKNWSSLMLLNCGHPVIADLTPRYVSQATGLELHRFHWCPDELIGPIRYGNWNVLSTPEGVQHPSMTQESAVDLLHYTHGGPWHGVRTTQWPLWVRALEQMLGDRNPRAVVSRTMDEADTEISVKFLAKVG